MTRRQLLAQLDSQELTGWLALFAVQAEEAKHKRDELESGDGQVIVSGSDPDADDDDEDEPDGEAE